MPHRTLHLVWCWITEPPSLCERRCTLAYDDFSPDEPSRLSEFADSDRDADRGVYARGRGRPATGPRSSRDRRSCVSGVTAQAGELASLRATIEAPTITPVPTVTAAPINTPKPDPTSIPAPLSTPRLSSTPVPVPTMAPKATQSPVPISIPSPTPSPTVTATQMPTSTPPPTATSIPAVFTATPQTTWAVIEFDSHPPGYAGNEYVISSVRAVVGIANGNVTSQIDWGDGSDLETVTIAPHTAKIVGSHVYAASGFYRVTIYVTNDSGGIVVESFDLMIGTSPTQLSPTPVGSIQISTGTNPRGTISDQVSLPSATVSSISGAGELAVYVDWGDGSPRERVALVLNRIIATHDYSSSGIFTITITAEAEFGTTASETVTAIIDP